VGPVDPIPNVIRAVERAGVMVIGSAHEIEKHYGASYWPDFPEGRPVICFSRGLPGDSERLTIGHEVGHLRLHQLRTVDDKTAEQEAFRFGSALLLPRPMAVKEIPCPVTLRGLVNVKARWGISIAALVKLCLDLELITPERATSLFKQISARGWRKNEPVEVAEEHPLLVRRVVEAATGTTKPAALAQRLGIPAIAISEILG
jgi:Zn-dependent peptidase ImmA (M78 family)